MKRDISLDYTRVILTFIIILFHFANIFELLTMKLFSMPNGTWTWGAVGAFTVMSGYLLRLRYKDSNNTITFYKKRLLTLFPPFYIAFLIGFIIHSIKLGSPFYGGHPAKILLTFIGFDSYAGIYGIPTYAIVGEWYTGVIILLYLLFPLINRVMNRFPVGTVLISILAFVANTILRPDMYAPETSMFTAIMLFSIGILLADHKETILKFSYLWIGTLILLLINIYIKMPFTIPSIVMLDIASILLFITLIFLFKKAGRSRTCSNAITFLSGISYEAYLIHHFILYQAGDILPKPEGNVLKAILYLIIVLIIIVLASFIINKLAKLLIKLISNIFTKRLEA